MPPFRYLFYLIDKNSGKYVSSNAEWCKLVNTRKEATGWEKKDLDTLFDTAISLEKLIKLNYGVETELLVKRQKVYLTDLK